MTYPLFIRQLLARRKAQTEFEKLNPMTNKMPLLLDWRTLGYPIDAYNQLLYFHLNPDMGRENLIKHLRAKHDLPTWQPNP